MITFLYMIGMSALVSALLYFLIAIIIVCAFRVEETTGTIIVAALTTDAVLTSVIMTFAFTTF